MGNIQNKILQVLKDTYERSFGSQGVEYISSGGTASSTSNFTGFIVGSAGVTISAISATKATGDLTSFPYSAGAFYPIEGLSITVSAGDILLLVR